MNPGAKLLAQVTQPRQAGVRGLGHTTRHVEVEDRLCRAAAQLCQPAPARITGARSPIATQPIADEIDIRVIAVGRPMALEVVEKRGPVGWNQVDFEVAQRKRKRMVDADKRGRTVPKFGNEPFGEAAARPVLPRTGRRLDFRRRLRGSRRVKTQALQATRGRFRAGVVDAKVAVELRHKRSRDGGFGDEGGKEFLSGSR